MRTYTVERVHDHVPLTGEIEDTPWHGANTLSMDTFPWGRDRDGNGTGEPAAATARMLYDDTRCYLQFHVDETEISAETRQLNGDVWLDSAVEWFVSPHSDGDEPYVNFEVNCLGTMLLGWGAGRDDRTRIDQATAADIPLATSVDEPATELSPAHDGWWLVAAIPFETLSELSARNIAPDSGTTWRCNFHCLRWSRSPYAVWNDIETSEPDFHRPEQFGRLQFA